MKEIESIDDIKLLVDSFYAQAKADSTIGPVFQQHILEWSDHLPRMYAFWSALLLGTAPLKGNVIGVHLGLNLRAIHFKVWLELFENTVDNHFKGEKAQEAKQRARSIANLMDFKVNQLKA
jgi:hemoglobin